MAKIITILKYRVDRSCYMLKAHRQTAVFQVGLATLYQVGKRQRVHRL